MPRFVANRPVLVNGAVLMTGAVFEASDAAVSERVKSGAVSALDKPKAKPKTKQAKPKAKTKN